MRQTEPEPIEHGPGTYCGPSCKQVTFADSVEKNYDVWGDYVVYTTSFNGTANHAYMANVVTGEEWRLEKGPWNQGGCTGIAVDDGVVSWAYARDPSQGPYIVELIRTFDLSTRVYHDLTCIEHATEEISIIWGLDLAHETLSFYMSDECLGCTDLYTVSLLDGAAVKRTDLGAGVIQTRAGEGLVLWTDLNQFNTEIMALDIESGDTTNLSNHDADQFHARIGGGRVVWVDHRNDAGGYYHQRNSDIYYYDLATGQTHEVCTDPAQQDQPDIDGDVVVWGDWRNNPIPIPVYPSEFENSDIYMKRISTGEETQLTDFPGMEYFPRLKGNRVYFMMGDDNNVLSVFMIELEP
jgi:beta propeller repeat protein